MASRKEQKERAKAERIAREQAAASQAARRSRIRNTLIALAVVAVAVIVVIASTSGGSGPQTVASGNLPKLPAQTITDLTAAARAAGCVTRDTTVGLQPQNRQHVNPGTKLHFATNPPSYGPHYPTPASDGDYAARTTPPVGNVVHAMEHGRVEIQYRSGSPPRRSISWRRCSTNRRILRPGPIHAAVPEHHFHARGRRRNRVGSRARVPDL